MQDISSSSSKKLSFEGHLKFQRKKGRYHQASPVAPVMIVVSNEEDFASAS